MTPIQPNLRAAASGLRTPGLSGDSTIAGFVDMERARSNPELRGGARLSDVAKQGEQDHA